MVLTTTSSGYIKVRNTKLRVIFGAVLYLGTKEISKG